jgi:hypothetical protein
MPIALHDAIKGAHVPVINLHTSDVRARALPSPFQGLSRGAHRDGRFRRARLRARDRRPAFARRKGLSGG